jgi:hypothetical protein
LQVKHLQGFFLDFLQAKTAIETYFVTLITPFVRNKPMAESRKTKPEKASSQPGTVPRKGCYSPCPSEQEMIFAHPEFYGILRKNGRGRE